MDKLLLMDIRMNAADNSRIIQWIDICYLFIMLKDTMLPIEVQKLGQCELMILEMERKAKTVALHQINENRTQHKYELENHYLLMQTEGFSRYWIYGLYEILRTFKQYLCEQANLKKKDRFPDGEFGCFNDFFFTLEILRIPLAKHELGKSGQYYNKTLKHVARIVHGSLDGVLGWEVYCPKQKSYITLTRRQIADTFLELANKIQENRRQNNYYAGIAK